MKKISYLCVMLAMSMQVFGQDAEQDLFDLSLEELMNIQIVSASKKAESSFKSPLSSTVVTKDEIMASGATTIEEALRLVPGMLIREETNGNFDVHIRGNDNLPPGNYVFYTENSMSLVMIDGRPVYNYINGGTFWEALPISLVDVERIEVVRGPATALYGPNAVTGVVNIITRKAVEKNVSVNGSAQIGTKNTGIYDLSAGTSLMDNKLKIRLSGNIEERDRDMEEYYSYYLGDYVPGDQVVDYSSGGTDPDRFPRPEIAKERKGANAFINYDVNDKINFSVSGGLQESLAQSVFMEQTSAPVNLRSNDTKYVNAIANVGGLYAQYSYNKGMTNTLAGKEFADANTDNWAAYDFDMTSIFVEYDLPLGKLTLRPGINYQQSTYSDMAFRGNTGESSIGGERTLSNAGYYLRADFKPTDKIRLVGALRMDSYNVPDDNYFTFQFVGTYNVNENNLLRATYSRANRGPFMMDSYADYGFGNGITGPRIEYVGSEELILPVMDMVELGYRGVLSSKMSLDLEVFHSVTTDITSFEPTFFGIDPNKGIYLKYEYINLDLKAKQTGVTFSYNFAPSSKVQLRAYATIQSTQLEDYDKKVTPVAFNPQTFTFSLPTVERMNTTHKQTPSIYGGVTGNFRPVEKFNVFAGVYYLGSQTYRHDYAANDESKGQIEMPGRAVVNIKASYQVYKNNSVFINARNAFNTTASEFGFADEIGGLYLAGVNIAF